MVVFSSLSRLSQNLTSRVLFRRMSDHPRVFHVEPSRFQWNKFKNYMHYYIMLGIIPCSLVVLCANVFVGPATLSEIPPDYVPKHWEYIRHPITRFIARYMMSSPQQEYEKYLAFIFLEHEKTKLRKLQADIEEKIKEREDYQLYYYRPIMAKYQRENREIADGLKKFQE